MSTLKVNGIRNTGASSDAITLASDGTCTAKVTNNLSHRNLIVNGAMNFSQRSTSSTSGGYQTVDRWQLNDNNTNVTITQSQHALTSGDTGPWEKGFRNSYSIALSAAGNSLSSASYARLKYVVEARDIACSGWDYTSASSYITLSFWFKASTNQTFHAKVHTTPNDQAYPFSFTASGNDTWTKITKTIPGNSNIQLNNNNSYGLGFYISLFSGADYTGSVSLDQWAALDTADQYPTDANTWLTAGASTFEITGVQLEVGDHATDFEHRSFGDELRRCQRYYYVHSDGALYNNTTIGMACYQTSSTAMVAVHFPVAMRARTSMTVWSGSNGYQIYVNDGSDVLTGSTFSLLRDGYTTAQINITSADGDAKAAGLLANRSSSSFIAFAAEL